ncbi:MAG: dTDP-4-dehydrorhamnose 3,5-epimerase family protein [bacterium]|nr:dTDP-4-dehydrorhamnose 3,5-epimerase family protein [bacterium]
MIEGLIIKEIKSHHDATGFFAELAKEGEESFREIKQTSYSETYPGVIKAFHKHDYWELWVVVKGVAEIALYDGRKQSQSKGEKQRIVAGEKNLLLLAIPPNVAHGYRALNNASVGILYHAAFAYDPKNPGIENIPYDSPEIGFDWSAPHG